MRRELTALGYTFRIETDTEAVAMLASHFLAQGHAPREAVVKTLARLDGAFALTFLFAGARGHDRPVALLEIGDAAGQRRQRQRVGAEEHLARAIADGERAAATSADQQIVLAGEQEGEREGAVEPR